MISILTKDIEHGHVTFYCVRQKIGPQLEYCAPVWHPWQDKLSYKVERVQRAAARYVLNDEGTTSSVTEMLKTLNWQTLESSRIKSSLILLYKTKYQLVAIDHFYLTEIRNLNFFVQSALFITTLFVPSYLWRKSEFAVIKKFWPLPDFNIIIIW